MTKNAKPVTKHIFLNLGSSMRPGIIVVSFANVPPSERTLQMRDRIHLEDQNDGPDRQFSLLSSPR